MKVEVVSKKMVKPHTPTPPHLKSYIFSFIDQLNPPMNIGIILFYRSKPERITDIEESLAKTLVQFYPLAGRYIDHHPTIDCSDQGVEFLKAQVTSHNLQDLIFETDAQKLSKYFLPLPIRRSGESTLVASIQATEFKCGGLALGISVSHTLFDTHSLGTFIKAWAGSGVSPDFNSPSLFPCQDREVLTGDNDGEKELENDPDVIVKRFMFNKDAIAALRSKLSGHRPISKLRAVSAFISLALIRVDRARYGKSRPCVISQPVNMRGRTIPPLPQHCCGNLVMVSITRSITATEVDRVGIQELVDLIRDATEKSLSDCARMFFPGTDRYKILNEPLESLVAKTGSGEFNVLWFTDFSKFGFYDADLGWGNPARVSMDNMAGEKMTVLLGNQEGDGVEAWLHLKRQDMSLIEQDEEMKMFAA